MGGGDPLPQQGTDDLVGLRSCWEQVMDAKPVSESRCESDQ